MLKVFLLTGQKRNEVAGMTRDELSDDGRTWNIPGSRTKNAWTALQQSLMARLDRLGPPWRCERRSDIATIVKNMPQTFNEMLQSCLLQPPIIPIEAPWKTVASTWGLRPRLRSAP